MTHNEVILQVAKSLRAKIAEDLIILAIRSSEGYSLAKAKTILGWAKVFNASRSPNQNTGCCI